MTDTFLTDKLTRCLQKCLVIAKQGNLSSLQSLIEQTLLHIAEPMQLAVIGNISSSKSTLVNALLGAEVVGMGMMETTYNVSWIKYGSLEQDVKAVFKDGHEDTIARANWEQWMNQSAELLKKDVLYLEVTYPHEILKRINIIDTPGLNSVKGTDSENTIAFLQKVKPDAVIMVFTKAIAESTMEVLDNFQNAGGKSKFHLSPLNAIGLYAKVDAMWSSKKEESPIDLATDVIYSNIYTKFPQVKNSLHAIFPICAIVGLGAKTLTSEEYLVFNKLATIPLEELKKLCSTPDHFIEDDISSYVDVSVDVRESMYLKYQLYGVYSIISHLSQTHCNITQLRDYLMQISGLRRVENRLLMHFGDRAVLIKTQNIAKQILGECKKVRIAQGNIECANQIEYTLLLTLHEMNEYNELDYLSKLYDGDTSCLNKEALEEYKALCGEYGYSVLQRLRLSETVDCDIMIETAQKGATNANRKANINRNISPENAELYDMMCLSYNMLRERIKEMQIRKQQAEQDLIIAKSFFYGD